MATPKLRFKEFDNQWDKITINDQAQTVTSGSRDWAQYYSESGDKFIRMTNLVRDGIYLDLSDLKFVQLPKNSNEGKRTSLKFGDILISITAELGKLGWIPEGLGTAYINQHTALVRMKDSVDSKFVAYSLSTEKYNNKLNSLNDSGAKAGLNLGTIRNFELIVPPKEEQTKIASFLSSVDEKISQLIQKHSLLSQYKQGMMQKLFSQQIRFKADDGSEFGEWEETTLGALYNIGSSKRVLQEDWKSKGIPFLRTREIISLIDKTNFSSPIFIAEKLYDELTNKYGAIKENDILVSGVGTVGKAYIVKASDKFYFKDGNVIWLRSKELNNSRFIYYFFQSHIMENYFVSNKSITTVDTFTIDQAKKVKLLNPSIEEQTKIANFLSIIDQKIEVVAQQIEQAKTWKKGLLQQMFV